jgi:DNA repair exonuclease SbcCD ATPase subunit
MTKEELELEAEEWVKKDCCNDCYAQDCKVWCREVKLKYRAYFVSAEPREKQIQEKDQKIAELEKEIKILAQNLEDTEILNKTYEKRFSNLEKENAELKGIKDVATLIRANNDTVVTLMQLNNKLVSKNQQLTKAKEVISEYINILKGDTKNWKKTQEKAEQFLKD